MVGSSSMTIATPTRGRVDLVTVVPIAPSTYFWHKARCTQIPRDGAHGTTATTASANRETSRPATGTTTSDPSMARARSGGNWSTRRPPRGALYVCGPRLMRAMAHPSHQAARGPRASRVTTTQADSGAVDRPVDLVAHVTSWRPGAQSIDDLVADFTYVATWRQLRLRIAFVIVGVAIRERRITAVGWRRVRIRSARPSSSMRLSRPSRDRRGDGAGDLVHHSDRGTQYSSIWPADTSSGWPTPASRCRSAVAATRTGATPSPKRSSHRLFKTEVIRRLGVTWRHIDAVEFARPYGSREVDSDAFNTPARLLQRQLECGYIPPAERLKSVQTMSRLRWPNSRHSSSPTFDLVRVHSPSLRSTECWSVAPLAPPEAAAVPAAIPVKSGFVPAVVPPVFPERRRDPTMRGRFRPAAVRALLFVQLRIRGRIGKRGKGGLRLVCARIASRVADT